MKDTSPNTWYLQETRVSTNVYKNQLVKSIKVDQGVYNGPRKIHADNRMFMTGKRILECVKSLKIKNTEGLDRIPQRIIIDGLDSLIKPLVKLFVLLYRDMKVPGQWLISTIIPVHKKSDKKSIENYRLVANLCCILKVFLI